VSGYACRISPGSARLDGVKLPAHLRRLIETASVNRQKTGARRTQPGRDTGAACWNCAQTLLQSEVGPVRARCGQCGPMDGNSKSGTVPPARAEQPLPPSQMCGRQRQAHHAQQAQQLRCRRRLPRSRNSREPTSADKCQRTHPARWEEGCAAAGARCWEWTEAPSAEWEGLRSGCSARAASRRRSPSATPHTGVVMLRRQKCCPESDCLRAETEAASLPAYFQRRDDAVQTRSVGEAMPTDSASPSQSAGQPTARKLLY
jgi:hypothetical protein